MLKYPIIHERIQNLLSQEDYKDEFSHTILHNQNVFDEFRAIQAKKKAEEEQKKKDASLEAKKKDLENQMNLMKLGDYKPKYGQDPQMYNEMYLDFISKI